MLTFKFEPDHAYEAARVAYALAEVLPRMQPGDYRLLETDPPVLRLVSTLSKRALGEYLTHKHMIRISLAWVDRLDDPALQGLLAHELAHAVRYMLGINKSGQAEEIAANDWMRAWGLGEEREALDRAKRAAAM